MGEYWRDVKEHFRQQQNKHEDAVLGNGLDIMRDSITKEGLYMDEDGEFNRTKWRVYLDNKRWVDFWPYQGSIYRGASKKNRLKEIRGWEGDWNMVGKTLKKLLTNP